jgi:hypothetical protein
VVYFSLGIVRALGRYRWWSIVGIAVVFLGNTLIIALWTWAVFSTPPGSNARYIGEAGFSFIIAAATLILALPSVVAGLVQRARRVVAIATLVLALTRVPLAIALMRLLAHWRNITLSP